MKIFGIIVILTGFSESKMSGIDLVDFQKPGGSRLSGGSSGRYDEDYVGLNHHHPCYNIDQLNPEYCAEGKSYYYNCWSIEQCADVFPDHPNFAFSTTTSSTTGAPTTFDTGPSVSWYVDVEPFSPTNNGRMTTFSVILSLFFVLFIHFF